MKNICLMTVWNRMWKWWKRQASIRCGLQNPPGAPANPGKAYLTFPMWRGWLMPWSRRELAWLWEPLPMQCLPGWWKNIRRCWQLPEQDGICTGQDRIWILPIRIIFSMGNGWSAGCWNAQPTGKMWLDSRLTTKRNPMVQQERAYRKNLWNIWNRNLKEIWKRWIADSGWITGVTALTAGKNFPMSAVPSTAAWALNFRSFRGNWCQNFWNGRRKLSKNIKGRNSLLPTILTLNGGDIPMAYSRR